MNKIILASVFLSLLLLPQSTYAHCPLCTAITGSAVTVARWYGVDDLIFGTFLGGFVISGTLWISNLLKKKKLEYLPYQSTIILALTTISTIATFYVTGLLGTNMLFGIDKIIIGTLAGIITTLLTFQVHYLLRNNNGNKNHIPFQAIVLTLVSLSLVASGFYVFGLV